MSTNQPKLRFELAMAETKQSQLRAAYYHHRIESKAYLTRLGKVFHLPTLGQDDKTPFTEEELRQDEIATMERHLELAQNYLGEAKHHLSHIHTDLEMTQESALTSEWKSPGWRTEIVNSRLKADSPFMPSTYLHRLDPTDERLDCMVVTKDRPVNVDDLVSITHFFG